MSKFSKSNLSKKTKSEIIKMLENESIEASTSQSKSELIKLLILAHKANSPTTFRTAKIRPFNYRRAFGFVTVIALFVAVFGLYKWNPTFKQNIDFLAYRFLGVGSEDDVEFSSDGPTIYERNGRTYVVYNHPLVKVKVITDTECKRPECDLNNYYNQIKNNITPLVKFDEISYKTNEGESLLEDLDISLLPVFVFDNTIEKVDNFEQLTQFFSKPNNTYVLQVTPLKSLVSPDLSDAHIVGLGADQEAPLTIVEYLSFSSTHSKDVVDLVNQIIEGYEGNLTFAFKYSYLTELDEDAAVAAECGGRLGDYMGMYNKLFDNQDAWTNLSSNTLRLRFGEYAREIGVDRNEFLGCFDTPEVRDYVRASNAEANELAVEGTPTFFVNNHILAGAYPFESFVSIVAQILEEDDVELQVNLTNDEEALSE